MRSYKEALHYLDSLINYEKNPNFIYNQRIFNLDRTSAMLDKLGNPHLQLQAIHIAGTKGKGSTAAIAAAILHSAGYKVGLYTSPHLMSPRERIKIGNNLISEEEFFQCLTKVKAAAADTECNGSRLRPTFFEIYTALAFMYFYVKKVDIAVIEVGLGGRLDATNVIHPLIAVITPISLDHTQQLGNDIISIAREKAGIIKPGSEVIISMQQKAVKVFLQNICQEKKVKFYQVGKDIKFRLLEATPLNQKFNVQGLLQRYPLLSLSLAGKHQLCNAATAIGAVELLHKFDFKVSTEHIKQGLTDVKWPGRIQIISEKPLILVDCAHNASSANFLAKFLKKFYSNKNIVVIIAVLKNKDVEGIAKAICPLASRVIVTRINSPRALPIEDLYITISRYARTKPLVETNSNNAIERARELTQETGVICITGSVYLVGEVLDMFKEQKCAS